MCNYKKDANLQLLTLTEALPVKRRGFSVSAGKTMHRHLRRVYRCFLFRASRLEFDLMSASSDLTANVAALQAAAAAYEAAVNAKLSAPAADDPAVVAANVALVGVTQQLDAATAALNPPAPAA